MLARLFVIFGGLLVLALLAALVVPHFIDWTSYRADFEREASAVLGREVTVHGAASARLLPFPSVTFNDVSVAGGPDGQPAMTIKTFSMDAELAPFLRGEVLIFDMRLVRPKAVMDIAADGTVDWAIRPSNPFDVRQVSIERMSITEGEIVLRHAAGARSHVISQINSTVSARSLTGPWHMDGSLYLDGLQTAFSASTGRVGEDGKLRVHIKADPDAYPLEIETDGNATVEKGAISYSGDFRIAGVDRNVKHLADDTGETAKPGGNKAPAEPGYRLRGKFQLDHRQLAVDEFRFETGPLDAPYTAEGKAMVDLGAAPHFSIEASGAQVQFDEAVGGDTAGGITLSERIAALETALARLPQPTIPGKVEVKLPAVVAGDTTIRDVHVSAEPMPGGWKINSLAATLPGRTTLEADGLLQTEGDFGFKGSLLLAVGQPSGFAAWLAKDVDEAIRKLPAAGFKAKVDLADAKQIFSELELVLGKASFRGGIVANEAEDARPSVDIRLEGGQLDFEGLTAFASLFVSDKGANRFSDYDLDFKVKAGPVDAGGLKADTVDTTLRLRKGVLEIDKLSIGGLAGASISATGRVKDFPANPTGDIDASVIALDLHPLIDMAAARYPGNMLLQGLAARGRAYPDLFQNSRLDVVASAADNGDGTTGLAISAQGKAGGSAFSASLSGRGVLGQLDEAPFTLSLNARNEDATALLALYGLPVLPLGVVGKASTDIDARGSLAGGMQATLNFAGENFTAGFKGTVTAAAQGPAAKGHVSLEAADIEPWLMTASVALPGMGLGSSVQLAGDMDYGNGRLSLKGIDGTVNELAVSGDVEAAMVAGKPHLAGALTLDELDLGSAAAMLMGERAFAPSGRAWPTVSFADRSYAPFTADFGLNAATLAVGPFAVAYDARFAAKLDDGGIHLADLKAKLFGGDLSGGFDLKNNGGTGLFSSQISLAGADLARALPGSGLSGTGDVSASVTTSGKSVDAMIGALAGSGAMSFKDLMIEGINPDGFPAIIARADAIGRDIDAAKTAGFAPEIASNGTFKAEDGDVAFTIAGGMLRLPPLTLENPNAKLSANVSADLGSTMVAASGAIAYRPGEEALVGSEPVVNFTVEGPIGSAKRSFDTGPLAQFLTQRALEKEQRRVEAMQASLLEKQRLRREARYYANLQEDRARAAEELRRQQEEEARRKAEAEAKAAEAAEEAMRIATQERERLEAERKAAEQAAPIEHPSLPPANDNPAPAAPVAPKPPPGRFSIENLLKSLGGG
ncbi:AsmA family protein [Manganibacter manganicus]|uniref:AsmA protein n=1 Tax=Manganibacter manganicus TaxID=1873176 RepID=A0A1V8RW84_9HYPH|nr:AsmA family protein [Pseudaminobacter manganicus]OQM77374.1 AsmA protein [Pseudaminobacter manganicus]